MRSRKLLKIIQMLFYLNCAIWSGLGVVSLVKISSEQAVPGFIQGIIAALMFGNAGAMILAGWGLSQRGRWFYTLTLAVIMVNIILTFTDQVGIIDWITLGIDLVLLILLLYLRKENLNSIP